MHTTSQLFPNARLSCGLQRSLGCFHRGDSPLCSKALGSSVSQFHHQVQGCHGDSPWSWPRAGDPRAQGGACPVAPRGAAPRGRQSDAAASCCSAFASTFSLSCSFSSLFLSISKTLPTTPYLLPLKANAPPLGPFWLSPAWAVGSGLRFDVTSG